YCRRLDRPTRGAVETQTPGCPGGSQPPLRHTHPAPGAGVAQPVAGCCGVAGGGTGVSEGGTRPGGNQPPPWQTQLAPGLGLVQVDGVDGGRACPGGNAGGAAGVVGGPPTGAPMPGGSQPPL